MSAKHRQANTNLLEAVGLELLRADPTERLTDTSLKIEYIPAELIRPDPIQPRRILPGSIHAALHANRLTPTQALRELVQLAQVAARQFGRPFKNVLDLLPNESESEPEQAELGGLSPEEQLIHDLVTLAVTIRDDGQVNPLTVVDVTQGVTRLYRIETGERRYWATWLVRDFLPSHEGDGTIPCIILPSGKASAFRQAKENTARLGLSAIAMARQAALLLLSVHGIERPVGPVDNDFYRQALNLNLRDKREFTTDILASMGGINRSRFSQLKALLQLTDEALELADRHNLDEFRLRFVLSLSAPDQLEMVKQIIDFNLTGRQVKDLCEHTEGNRSNDQQAPSTEARQIIRFMRALNTSTAQNVAQVLLQQEGDVEIVRARVGALKKLINEVERYLSTD